MTGTAKARTCETPAARQKRVWDKSAPGYDKQIAFFEKTWFGGGREWLGERAQGRVLEVAIGTGRNLPRYPAGATITVAPPVPQIADSAPLSTYVASYAATMPDGTPFVGTVQFGPPYLDAGGLFALSSNGASGSIIVSPTGPGLASLPVPPTITELITIKATTP